MESVAGDLLLKLDRYAASAGRAWHKALDTLLTLRGAMAASEVRYSRVRRNLSEGALNALLTAPLPTPAASQPNRTAQRPVFKRAIDLYRWMFRTNSLKLIA